jgi:hypothetical protein
MANSKRAGPELTLVNGVGPQTPAFQRWEGDVQTPDARFGFDADEHGNIVVVSGDLDLTTAPQLEESIAPFSNGDVIVDVTAVDFMDSSGLKVLVVTHRRLARRGSLRDPRCLSDGHGNDEGHRPRHRLRLRRNYLSSNQVTRPAPSKRLTPQSVANASTIATPRPETSGSLATRTPPP